jgi:hypothetical protein
VDFFLDPWSYNNSLHFAFAVSSADASGESAYVNVERFRDWGRQSELSRAPHPVLHPERSVANTAGTWRLTRSGNLFSGYTWDDGTDQWILLGSANMTATLPLTISIGAWSDRVSSSYASMMFDNLTIEGDTNMPTPVSVPVPGAAVLSALGVGCIGWWLRRGGTQESAPRSKL